MHSTEHVQVSENGLSRRSFLERLFTAAIVGAVTPSVLFGQTTPRILQKADTLSGLYTIDINSVTALQTVGGSVRLQISEISINFRIIVTRVSETHFEAVNAKCPHAGNLVRARRVDEDFLECAAHQSRFQYDGTFISGPADGQNLIRYTTTFDGNSIVQVEIDDLAGVDETGTTNAYVRLYSVGPLPDQVVFEFALERNAHVTLGIWSLDGREVMRLLDEHRESGTHRLACDTSSLDNGMYLYRLVTPDQVIGTGKLLVRE